MATDEERIAARACANAMRDLMVAVIPQAWAPSPDDAPVGSDPVGDAADAIYEAADALHGCAHDAYQAARQAAAASETGVGYSDASDVAYNAAYAVAFDAVTERVDI